MLAGWLLRNSASGSSTQVANCEPTKRPSGPPVLCDDDADDDDYYYHHHCVKAAKSRRYYVESSVAVRRDNKAAAAAATYGQRSVDTFYIISISCVQPSVLLVLFGPLSS